jgi:hypothetical protein
MPPIAPDEAPAEGLTWEVVTPLLTNRFMVYDLIKLLFWTGVKVKVRLDCTPENDGEGVS